MNPSACNFMCPTTRETNCWASEQDRNRIEATQGAREGPGQRRVNPGKTNAKSVCGGNPGKIMFRPRTPSRSLPPSLAAPLLVPKMRLLRCCPYRLQTRNRWRNGEREKRQTRGGDTCTHEEMIAILELLFAPCTIGCAWWSFRFSNNHWEKNISIRKFHSRYFNVLMNNSVGNPNHDYVPQHLKMQGSYDFSPLGGSLKRSQMMFPRRFKWTVE